ncbi:MAG: gamma-glutamyltransferase family protein [Candidatus Dormibacteria bacterium]
MAFTTRPELIGRHGMVASTHWLASSAGMAMLEAGGNAADAAVAAGFVLQVVEPHLNGLGGDAPILVAGPADELPDVICGQGPVPRLATIAAFHELDLVAVPGSGLLAACVPGAFDAWMTLLRDRGTMRLDQVLAPAIDYAEHGYPVLPGMAATLESVASLFREHWPTSAATYLDSGRVPAPGTMARNRVLAETYRRLVGAAEAAGEDRAAQVDGARQAYYDGFVAAAIDQFSAGERLLDGSGEAHAGLLRGEDMGGWTATVERPLTASFMGMTVCKCGPWSQGPVLLQQLMMLEALGIRDLSAGSAKWIHTVVEVAKLAFADRDAWYGDPASGDVPTEALLDPDYARRRAALVGATASSELRPGSPGGRAPRMPSEGPGRIPTADVSALGGEPTFGALGHGDTCHLDVVDRAGMMVSATPSGGWLQSSPVIPALGFCLGTRAQMTWLVEGLPSSLRPGMRPRTTLSPTMLMRDGRPAIAMGTPGGDQQDQWQIPVILRHLCHGAGLQEAIDAPNFHTNHRVSSFAPRDVALRQVLVESRLDPGVISDLEGRGHDLVDTGPWSLGRVSAVARHRDGSLRAAADPRGMQGYAVGR